METKKEQHVDPWHAEAAEGEDKIDYKKLISKNWNFYMLDEMIYEYCFLEALAN